MTRIATYLTAAAAALVLTGLTAGCSSDSSDTATPTSTVTVTPSTAASASGGEAGGGDSSADGATDAPAQETAGQTRIPAVSAVPPSEFADGAFSSFASPTGKIQCRAVDNTFNCQTEGLPHTVATSSLCNFYPGDEQGRAVRFGWFSGGPAPCATIIQGEGYRSPHTLQYGQRVTFPAIAGRTITCSSAPNGITCTQVGGSGARGFVLSAESFRVL
ncbi:hypothetical protein ASG12_00780 [Williamsia sp. Leaf354]|uniref:hypothetical protein n=1 Tax=Williamsia sp. Leaf354 TaxID=1736349 RepID=UPI000701771C|nr:hypothetical protein [Williamsia sp. Leaf354]KQR99407.1 hypothetical protein ASG12_00780 [Williamsia sp. Leaf354]